MQRSSSHHRYRYNLSFGGGGDEGVILQEDTEYGAMIVRDVLSSDCLLISAYFR